MKSYRAPFAVLCAISLALAAALAYTLWRDHARQISPQPRPFNPVVATGTSEAAANAAPTPEPPAPLLPISLTPDRLRAIGAVFAEVRQTVVRDEIRAPGNVAPDEELQSYVQLRFPGWIRKVFANSTYQPIAKGQPLFTVYSPDLAATEREYLIARQNRVSLAASSIPGVATGAASLVDAASARLAQWDVPPREIERLKTTGRASDEIQFDSPVSGFVTARDILPGMSATPETKLYTVTALSTVWVFAQVSQSDLGRVGLGSPATVTVDAYPGRAFTARVQFIYPDVDPATRTSRVRLVLPNPGLKLTPGMYVDVRIATSLGRQTVIPASGVLQTGTRQIAFVEKPDGALEPRGLELGPRVDLGYVVLKGLKPGERIAVSANFLLDADSQLQAALGSFTPPPPGAGAAASMNAPATTIDFSTTPSPPRKGSNTVRAKLTNADGSPVAGAQVSVTFYMPAMPAMGMAAVRVAVSLNAQSPGVYEAPANLPSGGTWQVSIAATRNGQTLAARQLSLVAEGGS